MVAESAYLAARPGQAVPRDELMRNVCGAQGEIPAGRAVDHVVKRLRKKIERDPAAPRHVLSIRGQGYKLCPLPLPAARPISPHPVRARPPPQPIARRPRRSRRA